LRRVLRHLVEYRRDRRVVDVLLPVGGGVAVWRGAERGDRARGPEWQGPGAKDEPAVSRLKPLTQPPHGCAFCRRGFSRDAFSCNPHQFAAEAAPTGSAWLRFL